MPDLTAKEYAMFARSRADPEEWRRLTPAYSREKAQQAFNSQVNRIKRAAYEVNESRTRAVMVNAKPPMDTDLIELVIRQRSVSEWEDVHQ